eukprot:5257801-Pleurochrysis_carterae.AAC.1
MRRCPLRRRLLLCAELRRARVAIMARAHVAIEADMRPRGGIDEQVIELVLASGSDILLGGVWRASTRGRQVHNASGAAIAESIIKSCSAESALSAHRPPRRAASEDRSITRHASVVAAAHAGSISRREPCDTSVGFEHSRKSST